jgi:hypothetical protein
MEKAQQLLLGDEESLTGFLQLSIIGKETAVPDAYINSLFVQYCRLLGILDAIWSSVRGIESGLLPTQEQLNSLQNSLQEGKALWLRLNLSTLQPKWHLTFDGHLFHQVTTFGGLADKSDDIEKGHQTLKAQREQFRRIRSYEQRETCIRREMRRCRSHEVQGHIARYKEAIKQATHWNQEGHRYRQKNCQQETSQSQKEDCFHTRQYC